LKRFTDKYTSLNLSLLKRGEEYQFAISQTTLIDLQSRLPASGLSKEDYTNLFALLVRFDHKATPANDEILLIRQEYPALFRR